MCRCVLRWLEFSERRRQRLEHAVFYCRLHLSVIVLLRDLGMSLDDTLPGPEDLIEALGFVDHDDSLLSTVGDLDIDAEMAMLLSNAPSTDAANGAEAQAAPRAAEKAAPKAEPKRRRRKASATPDPTAPKRTRAEICRDAAQARWAAHREASQAIPAVSAAPAPSLATGANSPVPAAQLQIVLVGSAEQSCHEIVQALAKPLSAKAKGTEEKTIVNSAKHQASFTAIGKQLGVDRKTVQNKMRLVASTIFFASSHRMWTSVQSACHHFEQTSSDFAGLLHLVKQRFDEMQIASDQT